MVQYCIYLSENWIKPRHVGNVKASKTNSRQRESVLPGVMCVCPAKSSAEALQAIILAARYSSSTDEECSSVLLVRKHELGCVAQGNDFHHGRRN